MLRSHEDSVHIEECLQSAIEYAEIEESEARKYTFLNVQYQYSADSITNAISMASRKP